MDAEKVSHRLVLSVWGRSALSDRSLRCLSFFIDLLSTPRKLTANWNTANLCSDMLTTNCICEWRRALFLAAGNETVWTGTRTTRKTRSTHKHQVTVRHDKMQIKDMKDSLSTRLLFLKSAQNNQPGVLGLPLNMPVLSRLEENHHVGTW